MKFLDLTLPTPAENLALDEALLLSVDEPRSLKLANESTKALVPADTSASPSLLDLQVLRVWRATETMVVLGRSSHVAKEVNVGKVRRLQIPVLRRFSGGAAVVIAPGCLLYSVLIHTEAAPRLRMLDVVHRYVMDRMLQAIRQLEPKAALDGTCDLVLDGRKFSGNSLKMGRHWILYHGTLLLQMSLATIDELLHHPPREPEYRRSRPHCDFVTNVYLPEEAVIDAIRSVWDAQSPMPNPPLSQVPLLVKQRYGQDTWNFLR